jgi:hypothetical protein
MNQLIELNTSFIQVRKKHAEEKKQSLVYIISQPSHADHVAFLQWNGESLDVLKSGILNYIEKASLLNNVINTLKSRFTDCFFPDFGSFIAELEVTLECLNDLERRDNNHSKLVAMLKLGLTIPIVHNIISYISHFHVQIISFIIKYVLIIPNELCVSMLVEGLPPKMDKIGEIYQSAYNSADPFIMIKSLGNIMLPFYEKRYDPSVIISTSSNQKVVEKKISYANMNEECMFVFDLFKNKKTKVEGFFYDFLLYDPKTKKIVVFFEAVAMLLNMKIDNVMRRLYTFTFDPSYTISLGSRICSYDSIPELNVIRINIMFVAYLSNEEKAFIRRININDLIGKEKSFEIRNHKFDTFYCMTLGVNRFEYTDTNNKIQIEKGCKLLGSVICPSEPPRSIDTNAAMVLFDDEMNVTYGFFPTSRCITYDEFVGNDDNISGFSGINAFEEDARSVKSIFEGNLISKTGDMQKSARLMIDYDLFISKTRKLNLIINSLSIQTSGMM